MIYIFKNKLLTIIYSIILGLSILAFTITSVVAVSVKSSKHDVTKISCEIIEKDFFNKNVVLKYKIQNNTTTDISAFKISTMVCVGHTYSDTFTASFSRGIEKKSEEIFTVYISSDINVYSDLKNNSLSNLNFKHYLTYVSFSDFVVKDDIDELIGSTFESNE